MGIFINIYERIIQYYFYLYMYEVIYFLKDNVNLGNFYVSEEWV